jgi:hypothetical protein
MLTRMALALLAYPNSYRTFLKFNLNVAKKMV